MFTPKREKRLEALALRQRWKLSDEDKIRIAEEQVRIATDAHSDDRMKCIAAKTLVSMESQNQADEHRTQVEPTAEKVDAGELMKSMLDRSGFNAN